MRKPKKLSETTIVNRTYNSTIKERFISCTFCKPHKGCNSKSKSEPYRSWKEYRKNQWK